MKVDENNGKSMVIGNGRYQKFRQLSSNGFWKNICCLVSSPTFDIRGTRLCDKEEDINMSGNNRKRSSIEIKVDLYEVCLS